MDSLKVLIEGNDDISPLPLLYCVHGTKSDMDRRWSETVHRAALLKLTDKQP